MSFQFKQFIIHQSACAQKVSEVACIQGAWTTLPSHAKRMLDIGSGTGLLSLMIAQRYYVEIDAIEIEEACFQQGKRTIEASKFSNRIFPVLGDVNSFQFTSSYDFIISNPPFFEGQLQADSTNKNLAKHSSRLTLEQLIQRVSELLNEDGEACFLFPFDRVKEVVQICTKVKLYPEKILHLKHSMTHEPKVSILHFTRQQRECAEANFIIKENGVYTAEMRELMKNYYLK